MRIWGSEWKSAWAPLDPTVIYEKVDMLESHWGKWGAARRETRWRQIAPRHHRNRKATWQWLYWARGRYTTAAGNTRVRVRKWCGWEGEKKRRGVGGMNHVFLFVLLIRHMDSCNDYNMRHVKINDTPGCCLHSGSLWPDADDEIKRKGDIISNTETGSVKNSSICQLKYL